MASEPVAHGVTTGTEVPQAEGAGTFPPFEAANFVPVLIWLAISFGLLYLLMSKIALPRVEGILHMRSAKINGDLHEAFEARRHSQEAAAAYDKTLGDAKKEAQGQVQETYAKLAAETAAKRQALEADLNAKLAAAEAQIADTKVKAMSNVATIAQDTAAAIVQQLTGKPADAAAIAAAIAQTKA